LRGHIESLIDYESTQSLFVDILPQHVLRAVGLARESGLRAADALHLAIAMALKEEFEQRGDELIFWTADKELVRAPSEIRVSALNPLDYE
jgi:predicted nucleic acid-binding protein